MSNRFVQSEICSINRYFQIFCVELVVELKKVELVASSERRSIEVSKNREVTPVACNGGRFIQSLPRRPGHDVRPCQTFLMKLLCRKYRSSHPEVFLVKGVLKIFSKFTGEHPCRSVISRICMPKIKKQPPRGVLNKN